MPTDAELLGEIAKDARRRRIAAWIAALSAAALAIAAAHSLRLTHGPGLTPVEGRIVAVGRDAQSGEAVMDIEVPVAGVMHRERETAAYHYAPGEPTVGEAIPYAYRISEATGDPVLYTRADGLLRWGFGGAAAFLGVLALGLAAFVSRQRRLRTFLVAHGLRLPAQGARVRERTLVLPVNGGARTVRQWRLEASFFEPGRAAFVECASEWRPAPAPASIDALPVAVVLVDPADPSRHWLPAGAPA
jgi:hypothetical protein